MSMVGVYARLNRDELAAVRGDPSAAWDLLDGGRNLDIDKAWQAIHFLLTGDEWEGEWPLAGAVMGGTEVGEDGGYGPARLLTPEQVREVAKAVAAIPPGDLRRRFDFDALELADIYPNIWDRHDKDDIDYVVDNYRHLRQFFAEAAEAGDGMLLALA